MEHLSERDTVGRFSDRVADYVRYRPSYPIEAIQAILEGLGPPERLTGGGCGSRDGNLGAFLAEQGVRVVAVEPGEDMRRAAARHPNVAWVAGRAEATGLQSAAFDLVVCAQSFHWFRPPDALAEFARILKSGRRLAIMWNHRSKSDPLTAGYREAIVEVGGEITAEAMPFDPAAIARVESFHRLSGRPTQLPASRSRGAHRSRQKRLICTQERRRRRTVARSASRAPRAACRCERLRDVGLRDRSLSFEQTLRSGSPTFAHDHDEPERRLASHTFVVRRRLSRRASSAAAWSGD